MVDLEAPQSSPELPQSSQKEPGRAPERLQNHFWIEKADFSKMSLFMKENQHFQKWEGRFGSSKSTPRGSERREKTTSTAPEPTQGHLRQQEASKPGPREFQDESGGPLWSISRPLRAPQSSPRAPKRSPREPQNDCKTIFGSKTLISQKCKYFKRKIDIF